MIWALDLATLTGECWGDGSRLPSLGHNRLPSTGDNVGKFLIAYRDWFNRRLDDVCPTLVVFEAPILPRITKLATVRKLNGLANVTEMVCEEEGLECREVSNSMVKKVLAGHGRAEKTDMVEAARRYGLEPKVEDEADGFGIWLATIRARFPKLAPQWDPLVAANWKTAA